MNSHLGVCASQRAGSDDCDCAGKKAALQASGVRPACEWGCGANRLEVGHRSDCPGQPTPTSSREETAVKLAIAGACYGPEFERECDIARSAYRLGAPLDPEPKLTCEGLVCLLYVLLRDELPSGKLERIIRDHVEPTLRCGPDEGPGYSSPELEALARSLAARVAP